MTNPGATQTQTRAALPVRVTYVRIRAGIRFFVIADFGPDGSEDFADQESGEVVWTRFTPSQSERTFAIRLAELGVSSRSSVFRVEDDRAPGCDI